MIEPELNSRTPRVLIASANHLFGNGLRQMLEGKWKGRAIIVGLTTTLEETLSAVDTLLPDLVILDYDDRSIKRDSFLTHFVHGQRPMQVALVSLQDAGSVLVYDRKALTTSQAEDWLEMPWLSERWTKSEKTQDA